MMHRDGSIAALQRELSAANAELVDGRKLRSQLAAETSRRERLTIQACHCQFLHGLHCTALGGTTLAGMVLPTTLVLVPGKGVSQTHGSTILLSLRQCLLEFCSSFGGGWRQ